MERCRVLFHLVLNLVFDVSFSNQTGRRVGHDLSSRDYWCVFRENPCLRTDSNLEIVFFAFLPFSRGWDWPVLQSEENRDDFIWWCKLLTIWRDFGGWNRASVHPRSLDIADDWAKFFRCRIGRPTSDLESHGAVTTDTMHLVVVPWGCIDGMHWMRPDKSISKFCKRCADIDKRSDVDTWRRCAF